MIIRTGCDVVSVEKFKVSAKRGGAVFLDNIFSKQELDGASMESLAGIFAAKESIVKACGFGAGDWRKIEITKNTNGRPEVNILGSQNFLSKDVSISHDGDYAFATATFLIQINK